ncbi:hypothetical protein HDE_04467 [Halotydeus destructor]|nr:hypothetical protein HDE_04467 [Halotydeus destructor]
MVKEQLIVASSFVVKRFLRSSAILRTPEFPPGPLSAHDGPVGEDKRQPILDPDDVDEMALKRGAKDGHVRGQEANKRAQGVVDKLKDEGAFESDRKIPDRRDTVETRSRDPKRPSHPKESGSGYC